MIISKGVRKGQLAILIIFGLFFMLLLLLAILTTNANYLLIILFGLLFFTPIYLIGLKTYDIAINEDNFIISNLFRKYAIDKSKFEKVVPTNTLPIAFNNPYFTIVFSDQMKYNFVYRGSLKDTFKTRVSRAREIKEMIIKYCDNNGGKVT